MRVLKPVERYLRQIDQLRAKYDRIDLALSELNTVCKSPEIYPVVIGTEWHRVKINPYPGVPGLSIYFRFDESAVYLLTAEELEADE